MFGWCASFPYFIATKQLLSDLEEEANQLRIANEELKDQEKEMKVVQGDRDNLLETVKVTVTISSIILWQKDPGWQNLQAGGHAVPVNEAQLHWIKAENYP